MNHDEIGLSNSVIQDMVEHGDSTFKLKVVSSMMKFDMRTRFLLQGQPFSQTMKSVRPAWKTCFNPGLAGVTEASIWKSVQPTIAINLQRVRDVVTEK